MMRIFSILFALMAGLASLLVSVCGGGLFLTTGYQAIRAMLQPAGSQNALSALPLLMMAGGFAAVGGWAFWRSVKFIRRKWLDRH